MHCPKCGINNSDTAKFCVKCGNALVVVPREPKASVVSRIPWKMWGRVIVVLWKMIPWGYLPDVTRRFLGARSSMLLGEKAWLAATQSTDPTEETKYYNEAAGNYAAAAALLQGISKGWPTQKAIERAEAMRDACTREASKATGRAPVSVGESPGGSPPP